MNDQIQIESAIPEDAKALLEIHYAAVHQTAAPFYSPEIINAWSRFPITNERVEKVKQKWIENPNHFMIVGKQNEQIIGFGFIDNNSEVQGLYVHPHYGRRVVGARILAVLEQRAIAWRLTHLQVDSSVNAEAFYRQQGFEVIEYATHSLASGHQMACVKMRKNLSC